MIFQQTALEIRKIIRDFNNYPVCDAGGVGSRMASPAKPRCHQGGVSGPDLSQQRRFLTRNRASLGSFIGFGREINEFWVVLNPSQALHSPAAFAIRLPLPTRFERRRQCCLRMRV
jgi:hypothetical protein